MNDVPRVSATGVGTSGDAVSLTVLICTHNRWALLERTIASINNAHRPPNTDIEILVVANACNDDTHAWLKQYARNRGDRLKLRWVAEPTPGKSHALNRAFEQALGDVVAFVDDDHRIDVGYLGAVVEAAQSHPEIGLFCGRILPDWDGSEPPWVHDQGPYRIYPLPVPRFDLGECEFELHHDVRTPGGGNLAVRRSVILATGRFSTELGPVGHNLDGAEDLDWVRRALRAGARLYYFPNMIQFHYVDLERLQLPYVVRKAFSRSKSVMRPQRERLRVPLYMGRKVAEYALRCAISSTVAERRFYLVRTAAALGEISGIRANRIDARKRTHLPVSSQKRLTTLGYASGSVLGLGFAGWLSWPAVGRGLVPVAVAAAVLTLVVLVKALRDFSQAGPQIRDEVLQHYRSYTVFALVRLTFWLMAISAFFGGGAVIVYAICASAIGRPFNPLAAAAMATAGIATAVLVQFTRKLRDNPGLIVASWQYRLSRLNRLRSWIIKLPLGFILPAVASLAVALLLAAAGLLLVRDQGEWALSAILALGFYTAVLSWAGGRAEAPTRRAAPHDGPPNILMIGADTLRADRILNPDYPRRVAPVIEALSRNATHFPNCYVPCARTAPSLISLFSGTWPHTHGVRDNFVAGDDVRLPVRMLPDRLREAGYRTVTLSDWCGADFAKFPFGFDIADVPEDQWNLKYLIRQGPKDLRLLLSLFCHNRLGRLLLPEIYYLGGIPQTDLLGRRARAMLSQLSTSGEPFLLNVFFSTTHPPFASETPWFERYADPEYAGESKFAMAKLSDPFDIIRRQGEAKKEFDLEQIIALYDGCVARFDDEIGRLLHHLDACGLAENTIVVVYSDHGMEFFEHDTWGQGNSAVGDFSARVPLLIADPRHQQGQRCDAVVRTVDVAPTLAALVGCDYFGAEGVSLHEIVTNTAPAPELAAFNETGLWVTDVPGLPPDHLRYPELFELLDIADIQDGTLSVKAAYRDRVVQAKDRMIRRGTWKLVYQPLENGERLLLFDLASDPNCTRDASRDEPEIAASLWQELKTWMRAERQSVN